MSRYTPNARCCECGRFMSFADMEKAVVTTPFGSATDLEPGDDEYYHRPCFEAMPEVYKKLIDRTSWMHSERSEEVTA